MPRALQRLAGLSAFSRIIFQIIVPVIVLFSCINPDDGYAQNMGYEYRPENVFYLTGDISLIYDRQWGSDSVTFSRFTHSYDLGLSGFVTDARIMTFQVNGSFTQSLQDPGETLNFYGIGMKIRLLNERPLTGLMRFFPQPTEFRYAYAQGADVTTQSYGISTEYSLVPFSKQTVPYAGAPSTGSLFVLPTFYLDYDRYIYTYQSATTTNDHLSLRAESLGTHANYTLDYEYQRFSDSVVDKLQYLDLHADYHFYEEKKASNLDIYNRLLLEDFEGVRSVTFSNTTTWLKYLGPAQRDTVLVNGGANYFSSSNEQHAYAVDVTGSYNKFFSDRFINYSALGLSYGRANGTELHSETVEDRVTYRLTRFLALTNALTAGQSQDGPSYGYTAAFLANGRWISASPGYSINVDDLHEGRTTQQQFSFDLSANPLRYMTFFSQNYYRITNFNGVVSPFEEKTLSLRADITWRISRYNIGFGVSYIQAKTTNGQVPLDLSLMGVVAHPLTTINTTVTTYYTSVSTFITRRMPLTVYAFYQREQNGPDTFYISPEIQWFYRRVTFNGNYTFRRLTGQGPSVTDHRLYVRLTRSIDAALRPFW